MCGNGVSVVALERGVSVVQRLGVRRLSFILVVLFADKPEKGMIVIDDFTLLGNGPIVLLLALEQPLDLHIFMRVVLGGMDG